MFVSYYELNAIRDFIVLAMKIVNAYLDVKCSWYEAFLLRKMFADARKEKFPSKYISIYIELVHRLSFLRTYFSARDKQCPLSC